MRVTVTGFVPGKKIVAIKGIRCATGLGLKESKDVVDSVEKGANAELLLSHADRVRDLEECGVAYRLVDVPVSLADFVDLLGRYDRAMTVGRLADVLSATTGVPTFIGKAA